MAIALPQSWLKNQFTIKETDMKNETICRNIETMRSVVTMMRARFPDVQWKLEDMVADEHTVAVQWTCSGTFTGSQPFAGIQPNGRRFSTTVMNFYSFDKEGKIFKDVAATGIAGILRGIGAIP